MFTHIVLLAVLAKLAVATHPMAGPHDLHARQTDVPAECSTIFEPLFTDQPEAPPEFASYWENNIPGAGNKTCMEPVPTSLSPVFESVYGDYATWWLGKTADLASIASKCFPHLAGGGRGDGDVEKRTAPPPIPSFGFSLPAEWATLSDFDFASLLPAEWQAYMTALPPCATTAADSTNSSIVATPTGNGGSDGPAETGRSAEPTPSTIEVNAADHHAGHGFGIVAVFGAACGLALML